MLTCERAEAFAEFENQKVITDFQIVDGVTATASQRFQARTEDGGRLITEVNSVERKPRLYLGASNGSTGRSSSAEPVGQHLPWLSGNELFGTPIDGVPGGHQLVQRKATTSKRWQLDIPLN